MRIIFELRFFGNLLGLQYYKEFSFFKTFALTKFDLIAPYMVLMLAKQLLCTQKLNDYCFVFSFL
ncbi:MAG TPA: hypothetical protein DG754_15000 [Bacteroidales bacterium]|nr:hypothetical protein [Bacteroidales bacterium]